MQFCSNSVECITMVVRICVFVCVCTGICVFVFRGEQWGLYRAGLRLGNSSCSSNSNVHCRRPSGSHHHFARTPSLNEAQRITILLQYYFNQWHMAHEPMESHHSFVDSRSLQILSQKMSNAP